MSFAYASNSAAIEAWFQSTWRASAYTVQPDWNLGFIAKESLKSILLVSTAPAWGSIRAGVAGPVTRALILKPGVAMDWRLASESLSAFDDWGLASIGSSQTIDLGLASS